MKSLSRGSFVLSLLIVLATIESYAQVIDPRLRTLDARIEKLNNEFPQQKIYIQFDQPYYTTEDVIKFKAFVLNYSNLEPDTISTNLYFELISSKQTLNYISILRIENGTAIARIELNDTIVPDVYRFRAYTNWSRNFGKEFMFEKYLLIGPPGMTPDKVLEFRDYESNKRSRKTQMEFFAEGGHFIQNLQNTLVARISPLSESIAELDYQIVDNEGNNIFKGKFDQYGFTRFTLLPESGKNYSLQYELDDKIESYQLPDFESKGYVLKAEQNDNRLDIAIKTNVEKTNDEYANSVFFLVQKGGEKTILEKGILNEKEASVSIDQKDLPNGLLLITIFDDDLEVVAERLIFNAQVKQNTLLDVKEKIEADSLILTLNFDDLNAISHQLSLRILEHDALERMFGLNIENWLLVESEIPGFKLDFPIHQIRNNTELQVSLDNQLIASKWTRFHWDNLIKDEYPEIEFPREHYLVVSGTITRQLVKLPLANSPVELTVLNEFYFNRKDTTGDDGRFYFDGIDLEDTINVKIEAKRFINDKDNVLIDLEQTNSPDHEYDRDLDLYVWFKKNYRSIIRKSSQKRYKQLMAQTDTIDMDDNRYRLHSQADVVLELSEKNASPYSYLADYIRGKIPGVRVIGSGENATYNIRGANSFIAGSEPLLLVDGMEVDSYTFNSIPPSDVEKIEVLKGPQAAIYGLKGANGVLAIYTKMGSHVIKGKLIFNMLGFQNTKDLNKPGVFLGEKHQDMIPHFNTDDDFGKPQYKVKYYPNKQYWIEGVLNGYPIRQKIEF